MYSRAENLSTEFGKQTANQLTPAENVAREDWGSREENYCHDGWNVGCKFSLQRRCL
jgi:hypothetical protein